VILLAYKKGFNDYEICGEYTKIYLRGKHSKEHPIAIIDTKNLQKLIDSNLSWSVHLEIYKKFFYVFATEYLGSINGKFRNKNHKLHRFILNETDRYVMIDHINRDTFDNRECNLRRAIHKNNMKNRRKKNSNNTSGYRNVCKIGNKWVVQLQINDKNKRLGSFNNVDDAGKFAEEMRLKHYGKFAGGD
jgi:hypothetical protein